MIPKHSTGLKQADFSHYFLSTLSPRRYTPRLFQEVWQPLIKNRNLYPTPTGRHALWYFLDLIKLEAGDEVLVQAYNFYVVVRLLVQKGLKPVFVDIDPATLCMDAEDLKKKITSRSKLLVVTHMFGNPAAMHELLALAEQNKLFLFEDCAHATGTRYNGLQVGSVGSVEGGALFSFGVMKSVSSYGGGMLVLTDKLARGFKLPPHHVTRWHSLTDTFSRMVVSALMTPRIYGLLLYPLSRFSVAISKIGMQRLRALIAPHKDAPAYRFTENERAPYKPFMASMHQAQLKRLGSAIAARQRIVRLLKAKLQDIEEITFLQEDKHGCPNYSYFGLYVPDKLALSTYLKSVGIDNEPVEYYDCSSLSQFSAYAATCEHAARASKHLIRLPSYQAIDDGQVDFIAGAITRFYQGGGRTDS